MGDRSPARNAGCGRGMVQVEFGLRSNKKKDMPLTDQQQAQFTAWLNDNTAGNSCRMCGASDWVPGDIIGAHGVGGGLTGETFIQVVMLNCDNCAHIELFNAVAIGLVA